MKKCLYPLELDSLTTTVSNDAGRGCRWGIGNIEGEISYLKGRLLKTAHLSLTVTKSHILQVVQEIRMNLLMS